MGVDLLAQHQRMHADTLEKLRCPGGGLIAARPADQLDQRQQIDRVERVGDDDPLRMRAAFTQLRRLESRGRGADHGCGRGRRLNLREHIGLDL